LQKNNGANLVTSGNVDLNYDGNFVTVADGTFHIDKNTADSVDIGFVQNSSSLLPFVIDIHYVMNSNESGIYYYVVYSRYNQPAAI